MGSEGDRFLVTPGDHHTLADRLFELIEDESLRFRLGAAMRARIENLFDIERAAEICERATNRSFAVARRKSTNSIPPSFMNVRHINQPKTGLELPMDKWLTQATDHSARADSPQSSAASSPWTRRWATRVLEAVEQ